eukprot:7926240-Pyramimonas_sp.AAC.1
MAKRFGSVDPQGRWSCFGWGAWCLLEMTSSVYKLKELANMQREVETKYNPGVNRDQALRVIAKSRRALHLNLLRSLLFLVPDIQWCLKPGSRWAIIPNYAIKGMCLAEALLGYFTFWTGHGCSFPALPDTKLRCQRRL